MAFPDLRVKTWGTEFMSSWNLTRLNFCVLDSDVRSDELCFAHECQCCEHGVILPLSLGSITDWYEASGSCLAKL